MEIKNLIVGKLYKLNNYKSCYYVGIKNAYMTIFSLDENQKYFMYLGEGKGEFLKYLWFIDNNLKFCYIMKELDDRSARPAAFIKNLEELY